MLKNKFRIFAMGVLTAVMIIAMALSILAEGELKTIKIREGGIDIYVDNKLQVPTDEKGNRIYPIAYEGTTYLPIRALTTMLTDKAVVWDAASQSVKIGASSRTGQEVKLNELEQFSDKEKLLAGKGAEFIDYSGKTVHAFNAMIDSSRSPILDGIEISTDKKFSNFKANLAITKRFTENSVLEYGNRKEEAEIVFFLYGKERADGEYKVIETYKVSLDHPTEIVNSDISKYTHVFLTMDYDYYIDKYHAAYTLHNISLVRK